MILSLVAAVADNGVIGVDGGLPWHLPDDLRYFKDLTMGHPVVMGRRTWDEVDRPLAGRRNVVVSRDPTFRGGGAEVVPCLARALDALEAEDGSERGGEVFVIGGGQVFALALPRADRIYLTRVHARPEGDTYFPEVDFAAWRLEHSERHERDARHEHAFTFERWVRKT